MGRRKTFAHGQRAPEPRPQIEELGRAGGSPREHLRPVPIVGDGLIGAIEEGRHLHVGDLAVAVEIGRSVKTRAHLMAEDSRLIGAPFVALGPRRGGEQKPEIGATPEIGKGGEALHRAALAPGTALAHQKVGIAGIHDEVILVGLDRVKNLMAQACSIKPGIFQG